VTSFLVVWGSQDPSGDTAHVATVDELDQVLDRVGELRSQDGLPFLVSISPSEPGPDSSASGLQVGFGHPGRGRLLYVGSPGGGLGYDPDLPAWAGEELSWDFGGVPTEDDAGTLRVTPEQARRAAREYVATGTRPTCVRWLGAARA
jgi:immunity protein Imm1 of predicted polymorphic toxin system